MPGSASLWRTLGTVRDIIMDLTRFLLKIPVKDPALIAKPAISPVLVPFNRFVDLIVFVPELYCKVSETGRIALSIIQLACRFILAHLAPWA